MAYQWEGGGGVKSLVDRGPFGFNMDRPGAMDAVGNIMQGAYGALGQLGNAQANAYGGYAAGLGALGQGAAQNLGYLGQGLAGIGNAQAGAYGAYSQGLGEIGKSIAQERAGFYGANAGAEAARQAALGNIGTAALSAYGGAANNAMSSWAQNQLAYNQALAGLGSANQTGLSQLGQSRNAALGSLGNAYAGLGGKLAAASAIGDLNLNMGGVGGGDGFQATGPNGQIASGSYGATGPGGISLTASKNPGQDIGAPAYAGLSGVQNNLMASDISDSMNRNYADSMNRLDAQHATSRGMPSQMLGQTLSGLMTLGQDAYGQVRGGMNQFYATQNDPRNRGDYGGILSQLAGGFQDVGRSLDGSRRDMTQGFRDTGARIDRFSDQLGGAYGTTSQRLSGAMDTVGRAFGGNPMEQARAADLFNRNAQLRDEEYAFNTAPVQNDWTRRMAEDRRNRQRMMPAY